MKGLKIVLWFCGICFLLGVIFALLPGSVITAWFEKFGVTPPTAEPLSAFIFRIIMMVSGAIGIFFILLARNPLKYGAMLSLASYGMLGYGALCIAGGLHYAFPLRVYIGDALFGLLGGFLILIFRKQAA